MKECMVAMTETSAGEKEISASTIECTIAMKEISAGWKEKFYQ
jgi:hypothetical protein